MRNQSELVCDWSLSGLSFQLTTYEVTYLDQTTRLPGLHVLSGEGATLVARAGADRPLGNQLRITAERRWLMRLL